jgi:hypothetical protein
MVGTGGWDSCQSLGRSELFLTHVSAVTVQIQCSAPLKEVANHPLQPQQRPVQAASLAEHPFLLIFLWQCYCKPVQGDGIEIIIGHVFQTISCLNVSCSHGTLIQAANHPLLLPTAAFTCNLRTAPFFLCGKHCKPVQGGSAVAVQIAMSTLVCPGYCGVTAHVCTRRSADAQATRCRTMQET